VAVEVSCTWHIINREQRAQKMTKPNPTRLAIETGMMVTIKEMMLPMEMVTPMV